MCLQRCDKISADCIDSYPSIMLSLLKGERSFLPFMQYLFDRNHISKLFTTVDFNVINAAAQEAAPANPFQSSNLFSRTKMEDYFISCCLLCNKIAHIEKNRGQEVINTLAYIVPQWLSGCCSFILNNKHKWMDSIQEPFTSVIQLFSNVYNHLLLVLDDEDFYLKQKPLNLVENKQIALLFKDLVYSLYIKNTQHRLRASLTNLLNKLHTRDSRNCTF